MNKDNKVILDNKSNSLSLIYKNKIIYVKVIQRKRKSISIRVVPKYTVELIAPKSISILYLKDVLVDKYHWIVKSLDKFELMDDRFENRKYTDGEIYYYLGKEYKLEIVKDKNINNKSQSNIFIRDNNLIVNTNSYEKEYIKNALKKWYKSESEKIVENRLEILKKESPIMNNLSANLLKIKEQKKRWGSCTSKKAIYINSKISMAPLEVIDYILVHEFSHLVHMNHSKDFYKLVEEILPNFRQEEKWLKENSYKLTLE